MTKHRLKSSYLSAAAIVVAGLIVAPNMSLAAGTGAAGSMNGSVAGTAAGSSGQGSVNGSSNMSNTGASASGSTNVVTPRETGVDTPTTLNNNGLANNALSGGQSASHVSKSGMLNTNGPNATHRKLGMHRAALRHQQHPAPSNLVPTSNNPMVPSRNHIESGASGLNSSTGMSSPSNNASTTPRSNLTKTGTTPGANTINATGLPNATSRTNKRSNMTNTSMPIPKPKPVATPE
jgi:hypothetical protein